MERRRVIAGGWSGLTLLVGCWWALGGAGFPFGAADARAAEVGSLFGSAAPRPSGLVVLAVGAAGIVLAVTRRPPRGACLLLAAVLLLAVPDIRLLQNTAYLFFGFTGLWDGALLAIVWSVAGGLAWLALAAPVRGGGVAGWERWLLRHRTGVTRLAAALALPYPVVRIGWALGIPVGVPAGYLDGSDLVLRLMEAGLGLLAIGGAVLTLGLVRPWGRVVPRWVPRLGGRPVPVRAAVVPGLLAGVMILAAGLRVAGWTVSGEIELTAGTWGTGAPGLAWPAWGLAVAAATHAYALARRAERVPVS